MVWASQSQKLLTDCRAKKMTNWRNRFSVARAVSPPLCHVPWLMSVSETSQEAAATALSLPLSLSLSLSVFCWVHFQFACVALSSSMFHRFMIDCARISLWFSVTKIVYWIRVQAERGRRGRWRTWHDGMEAWWHGGLVAWLCLPAVAVAAFAFLRCNLTISSQNCFGVCGHVRLWHAAPSPPPQLSLCLSMCVCVCDLSKVVDLRISVYMKAKVINNFQAKQCRRFSPVHD